MKFIKKLLLVGCVCFAPALMAQKVKPVADTLPEPGFMDDYFITASLDSLESMSIFSNSNNEYNAQSQNKYNFLPNFVPSYHDSVYFYRLQKLDVNSPFDLVFNNYVRSFIDAYSRRHREGMRRVLGLAQMYFPMYEQILDQYNLPLELKYLSIVESSLNSVAKSRVGASGLWQFMYYTGKMYDLNVTSYVDDRCDPYKSTVAAARHFKDLYAMFKDWQLVLAAYNSGAGNVRKAIVRSGGKTDFWSIRPFLPRETRDYVPAFMAVVYVMNYTNEHNLYPQKPRITFAELDTLIIKNPVSLQVIANKLNCPLDELQFLNPSFRYGFIPAYPGSGYALRIPKKFIADFLKNEQEMYAEYKLKAYEVQQLASANEPEYTLKKSTHKVRKNETIGAIAKRYHCTISEIKRWNGLRKNTLKAGKYLAIYTRVKNPDWTPPENLAEKSSTNTGNAPVATSTENASKNGEMVESQPENGIAQNESVTNKTPDVDETDPQEDVKTPANHANKTAKATQVSKKVSIAPKYHNVKKGEALGVIAEKYGISLSSLRTWNKIKGNKIIAGQKLRINAPYKTVTETVVEEEKTATAHLQDSLVKDKMKFILYTVKPEDTLWTIARKYDGITVKQIKEWNNLKGDKVTVGQKIKVIVPGG